ncbi:MAG: CBS domain-containing protein [Sedimentisphaerales bacterium]|nr:CBS domain-containing protein [Sedimentisphaerales bacterium]
MEHSVEEQIAVDVAAGRCAAPYREDLKIGDIMSTDVVTAMPGDTVFYVARRMSEAGISCLVVVDGERVVGIVTERDMLRTVADTLGDLQRLRVTQAMSSPVQSAPPTLSVLGASRVMQARQIRRLPVLEDRRLMGIVTETDITRGLITLIPLRSISEIMTREVATVAADDTVAEAARIMSTRRISCVLVLQRDEPTGILTEKDVIRRVATPQRDPAKTCVADVMSSPITTVPPSYSVLGVSRKMDALHLHRVVVAHAGQLCGIVTQTDIMRAVRAELERVQSERWGWMMALATEVRHAVDNLQRLEALLQTLSGSSPTLRKSTGTRHGPADSPQETLASTFARG